MRKLKLQKRASLLVLMVSAAFGLLAFDASANDRSEFDGEFSSVVSSSPDCDAVFAQKSYHGLFQLTGPTRRTLVSNFKNDNNEGFFHSQIFVSLFGYNNDFLYQKTITNDNGIYDVRAEGFVDFRVVYIEFVVKRTDVDCTATATYYGFN